MGFGILTDYVLTFDISYLCQYSTLPTRTLVTFVQYKIHMPLFGCRPRTGGWSRGFQFWLPAPLNTDTLYHLLLYHWCIHVPQGCRLLAKKLSSRSKDENSPAIFNVCQSCVCTTHMSTAKLAATSWTLCHSSSLLIVLRWRRDWNERWIHLTNTKDELLRRRLEKKHLYGVDKAFFFFSQIHWSEDWKFLRFLHRDVVIDIF